MLFFYIFLLFKLISSESDYCDNNFIKINFLSKNRFLLKGSFPIYDLFQIILFINSKEDIIEIKTEILKQFEEKLSLDGPYQQEHFKIFNETLDKFLSFNNKYFNETFDAILYYKTNLNEDINNIIDKNNEIEFLSILSKYDDIINPFLSFVKENPNILNILFLTEDNYGVDVYEKEIIFGNITEFLTKYIDFLDLFPLIISQYDGDKDIINYDNLYENIANYADIHLYFLCDAIGLFALNPNLSIVVNKTFENYNNKEIKKLCNFIYNHSEKIYELYEICNNDTEISKTLPIIVRNMNDKKELIYILLTNQNITRHKNLLGIFFSIGFAFVENEDKAGDFVDILVDLIQGGIKAYIENDFDKVSEDLSESCLKLINYTILGIDFDNNDTLAQNISKFFVYKALIDTTKGSNDLLNYDNCLKKPPILTDINMENIKKYGAVPAFFISAIDNSIGNNKNKFKKSTQLEETYNVVGICLPKGINYERTEGKNIMCTDEEYSKIIGYIFNLLFDTNQNNVKAFSLKKDEKLTDKTSIWIIIFGKLIPFYIILIPFILFLILSIFKNRSFKKKIPNNNENLLDEDSQHIVQNEQRVERKTYPKWIKYLNEFFNLIDNAKELFNFENKKTNFNDINGLRYIGGLMGISIILTILGQVYLILYNLPMKDFGPANFYSLFKSFFYIFFFIGLRYSPRIIFSCSGFTLSFKYISFINNLNEDIRNYHLYNCLIFILRHFFKYIIFIIVILFGRYSHYYLSSFFFDLQPINELFNENVLMVPKSSSEFLLNLLFVKSFQFNKNDSLVSHYFIDYFWMPINEIIFFLFGTILITIGFKYKLRIDIGIIIFVLLLYSGKIIFYFIYYKKENILYTTLYYYIFDYGEIMLNPIFNLSYYLIGMYFGLINYCDEKGVLLTEEKNIELFHTENDNNKEEDNEFDNEIIRKSTSNNEKSFQLDDILENDEINKSDISSMKSSKRHKLIKKEKEKNKDDAFKIIKKNISPEIEIMPFLKSPVMIKEWFKEKKEIKKKEENAKQEKRKLIYLYILLIILSSIIVLFSCSHYIFVRHYEKSIKNNDNYEDMQKIIIILSLENVITNSFLNIIYLIDIELVVLFSQWTCFILLKKNQFIIDFFNHIYWTFFNKFYFSFLLACNTSILYIFFQSETVVKLNTFNLWLYFFISTVFIFIVSFIFYISLELPLKKISKYLLSKDYKIDFEKQLVDDDHEEDDEMDEMSNDDDDEDEDEDD